MVTSEKQTQSPEVKFSRRSILKGIVGAASLVALSGCASSKSTPVSEPRYSVDPYVEKKAVEQQKVQEVATIEAIDNRIETNKKANENRDAINVIEGKVAGGIKFYKGDVVVLAKDLSLFKDTLNVPNGLDENSVQTLKNPVISVVNGKTYLGSAIGSSMIGKNEVVTMYWVVADATRDTKTKKKPVITAKNSSAVMNFSYYSNPNIVVNNPKDGTEYNVGELAPALNKDWPTK